MKGSTQFILAALLTLLVLTFAAQTAQAQDLVKVAPQNCKVILENDRVRVIEVTAKPGEKIPMHSHPAHILYFLSSGGKMATAFPDGKTVTAEGKAGDVRWLEPVTHANENAGTTEIRVLVVELKESAKEQKQ